MYQLYVLAVFTAFVAGIIIYGKIKAARVKTLEAKVASVQEALATAQKINEVHDRVAKKLVEVTVANQQEEKQDAEAINQGRRDLLDRDWT